jgi:hypothetical protein
MHFTSLIATIAVLHTSQAFPQSSTSSLPLDSLPDNDPFYGPPSGYENAALGSILRYRKPPRPISLNNVTPIKPKAAWQIQFRTQNSLGKPEAGVVTVLVPYKAKKGHLFVEGYFVDAPFSS